jgi:RNA polymerase alpha subunit
VRRLVFRFLALNDADHFMDHVADTRSSVPPDGRPVTAPMTLSAAGRSVYLDVDPRDVERVREIAAAYHGISDGQAVIDDSEVLAGLAFLERHARSEFQPAIRMTLAACENFRHLDKLDQLRLRSIDDLEISIRLHAALCAMGIKTVGEVEALATLPDPDVLVRGKRHHFGKKCLKEVRAIVESVGLGRRS